MKRAFPALCLACLWACGSSSNNAPTAGATLQLDSVVGTCPVPNLELSIDQIVNGQANTLVNGQGNATVTCTVSSTSFSAQVYNGSVAGLEISGSIPTAATGCSTSSPCAITGVTATMTATGINSVVDQYSSSSGSGCTLSVTSLSAGKFQGSIICPSLLSATAPQTYGCKIIPGSTFLFTNCSGG